MLRRYSAQKRDRAHDAILCETFMGSLFGDAWRRFWNLSNENLSGRYLSKADTATSSQPEKALELLESSLTGNQRKLDIISFEPPRILNVAAGLYIPPLSLTTPVYAGVSTGMEDEKSEVQARADSEDMRQQHSVAESGSPFHPHQRRRQKLYTVRHQINLWGKAAWRKATITKQRETHSESEVAL